MGKVMGKTMAREVGEAMVVGRVQKSAEYWIFSHVLKIQNDEEEGEEEEE